MSLHYTCQQCIAGNRTVHSIKTDFQHIIAAVVYEDDLVESVSITLTW